MSRFILVTSLFAFAACTPAQIDDGTTGDDTGAAGDDGSGGDDGNGVDGGDLDSEQLPDPAPLVEISGDCPDVSEDGTQYFTSAGEERKVLIYTPDEGGADLPVVFIWHPLGATASQIVSWLDADSWANAYNAVIVVPDARSANLLEWDFWNDDTYDLTMYDDLRTCLSQDLEVDLSRIAHFGFSAGALWTSKLSILRGDTMATAVVASGGCELELPIGDGYYIDCEPPAFPFPALTMWGGSNDVFGFSGLNVYFEESMTNYRELLIENDHFVVSCNHELGHTIPGEMITPIADWLVDHTYGAESPYEDGIDGYPSYCWID
jgi:hypothetical protein